MADQAEEAAGRQDRRGAAPETLPVRDRERDGPDRGRTGGRLPDPERVP